LASWPAEPADGVAAFGLLNVLQHQPTQTYALESRFIIDMSTPQEWPNARKCFYFPVHHATESAARAITAGSLMVTQQAQQRAPLQTRIFRDCTIRSFSYQGMYAGSGARTGEQGGEAVCCFVFGFAVRFGGATKSLRLNSLSSAAMQC
jgi:hypothetical protein